MASKKRLEADQDLEAQNLLDAQVPKPLEAITDQFQCGKCKQRKVRPAVKAHMAELMRFERQRIHKHKLEALMSR